MYPDFFFLIHLFSYYDYDDFSSVNISEAKVLTVLSSKIWAKMPAKTWVIAIMASHGANFSFLCRVYILNCGELTYYPMRACTTGVIVIDHVLPGGLITFPDFVYNCDAMTISVHVQVLEGIRVVEIVYIAENMFAVW